MRRPYLAAALLTAVVCARSYNRTPEPSVVPASAYFTHDTAARSTALDRIDQRALPLDGRYIHTGSGRGVTVYVFDGGILPTHPELLGRVRIGFTPFPTDPKICNSHGTAVAGAIAGKTLGVAPEAEIVDVKMVVCSTLRGTIKGIADGAKWVVSDHAIRGGPAVANWSFIADTVSDIPVLDSAVTALRAAGISVVVSAGNTNVNACRSSPANAEGVIAVGASMTDERKIERRAYETAFGKCIDIYAPGDSVLLPSFDMDEHPTTMLWSGTSLSAGYVSGAAALYLETHPLASPDEVTRALKESATKNVIISSVDETTRLLYVRDLAKLRLSKK
jgi:subtilisin family serine protease